MFRWILRIDEAALAGLPELALFPNNLQRLDALQRLEQQTVWSVRGWGLAIAPAILYLGILPLLFDLLRAAAFVVAIALMIGAMVLIRFILVYLNRRRAAVFLRQRLLECYVPVCLDCGYCQRGLVSDRCPECGKELDERVRAMIREETQPDGGRASSGV